MRKAILPGILAAGLMIVAALAGCTGTSSGNIITEERDFADFTRVEVEGTFKVDINSSDSFSISVSADENLFDYVEVAEQGDTLRIYLSPHHSFTDFTAHAKTLKAKVTMPRLNGLQISGASSGTISGFESSEDLELDVSGASSLNIDDIEVGDTEFEISGASKVTGGIKADDTEFEISGASNVKLDGSANNIVLRASGASGAELADFPVDNADVTLSGASEATINVKGTLDCDLSAASSLFFRGNPTLSRTDISGASTIKHE